MYKKLSYTHFSATDITMLNEMSCSSELFKLNYFDSQGWNHHQQHMDTTATIRNPISYNLEEDRSKHHLRHFSANDRRIRNSTYSPSSSTASSSSFSTSTFTYQYLPSTTATATASMSTCSSSHLVSSSSPLSSTSKANMELDKPTSNPRYNLLQSLVAILSKRGARRVL